MKRAETHKDRGNQTGRENRLGHLIAIGSFVCFFFVLFFLDRQIKRQNGNILCAVLSVQGRNEGFLEDQPQRNGAQNFQSDPVKREKERV